MSIVTLKRKSNVVNSTISDAPFSLYGKLRQPPPNLIRTPTYTRMIGTAPVGVGAGSHCRVGGIAARICKQGYPIYLQTTGTGLVQKEANKCTLSNRAMLETRFRKYVIGPLAVASSNGPSKTYTEKIEDTARKVMNCSPLVDETGSHDCFTTKNTNKYTVQYDTYLIKLKSKCVKEALPEKIWFKNTLSA
jgi:hypothetical protein